MDLDGNFLNFGRQVFRNISYFGTIEQNLPQAYLKILLWPLWQERGSTRQRTLVRELKHNIRLGSVRFGFVVFFNLQWS